MSEFKATGLKRLRAGALISFFVLFKSLPVEAGLMGVTGGSPLASTAVMTVSANVALVSVQLIAASPNRKGLYIYNNSANTIYLAFDSSANSANHMTLPLATFATWAMPYPTYTGPISGIRNSGTGNVILTELQ